MRHYEAQTIIDHPVDAVWAVMTDLDAYADWDSGVSRLDGVLAPGARLELVSDIDPNRTFKLRVEEVGEGHMTFRGGAPLGLFTGRRTYRATATVDGTTAVVVREEFSGPLLPLIWRSMPDLQPSFETYVSGLGAEVERRSRP